MKVTSVSASIRYAKEIEGAWKTLELSAEASVDPEENWTLAQQGLYAMLVGQLRSLWGQNGHNLEHSQNGSESHGEEPTWEGLKAMASPAGKPKEAPTYCEKHKTQLHRFEKDGKAWHSHKTPNGWCKG
jgi:hypothetical protein